MDKFKFKKVDVLNKEFKAYCETHNRIFSGNKLSKNWFRWYHIMMNDNTRTYGVYDGDRLIGIFSVEPRKFLYKDEVIKVGRVFGVGVEEEYRDKGLFVQLSEFATKQEKQRNELEYMIAYPRWDNVVLYGYTKSGWYKIFDIPVYEFHRRQIEDPKPLKNIVNMGSLGFPRFYPPADGFINDSGVRRFFEHPESIYNVLSTDPHKNYIVLKPFNNWCHILDVMGEPEPLLEIAKTIIYSHGWDHLTIWCADKEIYKKYITEAGFQDSNRAYTMIVCNVRAEASMKIETCHLQNWTEEIF